MRKRIAVFANGWGSEFLQEVGHGMRQVAALADTDLFAFVNYTAHGDSPYNNQGEFYIFKLPDLNDFDGAIVLTNSFNEQMEIDYVHKELLRTQIPAISVEYRLDGVDYFGVDDYAGMHELTEHLLRDHGVRDIMFIAGMKEHAGSNIRLQAVRDTMADYDLVLSEDNILYGDFAAQFAIIELEKWCNAHEKMPEAVICANDIMAMGVCDWLKERGYNIPEDIKVTGFDCLKAGQQYEPRLTTVNREWASMGMRVMEKLLQKINGEEVDSFEEIGTSLVRGASCGCEEEENEPKKKNFRKNVRDKDIDGFSCDQHFRHMYLALRKNETPEDFKNSMSYFYLHEGWLEGRRVMMCLHPDFFVTDNEESMRQKGYPEEMDVACAVYDGEELPVCRMKTREALFFMAERSVLPGTYIFVPLKLDDAALGFAMMSRGFSIAQNGILYIWTRHMNEYLEQVRSNVRIRHLTKRLEALSVTDALTGVYNRTGCETRIYPLLEACQLQGGQSVVMIADVDRLKSINDTFGHGSGDLAIKLSVDALSKALPEGFMVGRYGGDEFLIGGCLKEKTDIDALIEQVAECLKKEAADHNMPFALSMSMGGIQLEKGAAFNIEECVQKADAMMYDAKTMHHQKLT